MFLPRFPEIILNVQRLAVRRMAKQSKKNERTYCFAMQNLNSNSGFAKHIGEQTPLSQTNLNSKKIISYSIWKAAPQVPAIVVVFLSPLSIRFIVSLDSFLLRLILPHCMPLLEFDAYRLFTEEGETHFAWCLFRPAHKVKFCGIVRFQNLILMHWAITPQCRSTLLL